MNLTKNESAILEILWSSSQPLSRAEILSRGDNKSWHPTAIHAVLNSLLEKGLVRVSGFFKEGRSIGRKYEAAVEREAYFVSQISSRKPNLSKIFTAFLESGEYGKKTLDELEEIIRIKKVEWGLVDQ